MTMPRALVAALLVLTLVTGLAGGGFVTDGQFAAGVAGYDESAGCAVGGVAGGIIGGVAGALASGGPGAGPAAVGGAGGGCAIGR